MSINTYSDLQTAVANWLHRDDATSRIPEFIALAEAKIRRELRTVPTETKTTSYSINGEYVALPTSFAQVRSFQTASGGSTYSLRLMPLEQMASKYGSDTGAPQFYAVTGGYFRFAPIPDATYTATLTYWAYPDPLATTATNDLLTNHPDVYLYGAMVEASAWLQDAGMAQSYKALFDEAMAKVNGAEQRKRWGGPGLQIMAG